MSFQRHSLVLLLTIGALLLGITGIRSLSRKASLPVAVQSHGDSLMVTEVLDSLAAGSLRRGDVIVAVNEAPPATVADIEFLLDAHPIGDRVVVTAGRGNVLIDIVTRTVRVYSDLYSVIIAVVSLLFFCTGTFVFLRRPHDPVALVYHLGSLWGVVLLTNTTTLFSSAAGWLEHVSRAAFYLSYTLVPACFLHLSTIFPERRWAVRSIRYGLLYLVAIILGLGAAVSFFDASASMALDAFHVHLWWFTAIRLFLLLTIAAGLLMVRYAFKTAKEESERRKLRWIFWGLFVGFTPFLVLWVLPQMLLSRGLVPEEIPMLATGCIPVAFGFAILKYHALDIDILFRRSVVYGTVMVILLMVYVTIVGLVAGLVSATAWDIPLLFTGVIAVSVALLFEPTRRVIQRIVDRRFFRVRYDYRMAERAFLDKMKECVSIRQIAELLVQKTDELIPVERIGFFALEEPGQWLNTVTHKGFDLFERHRIRFHPENLRTSLSLPVALDDEIEAGIQHETADEIVFHKWGLALVFALLSQKMKFLGFLVLGPKRSGTRFSSEDVDLLSTVAYQAGLEIERITLQEEVLRKETETRHLRALNDLKSEFVSYVSHELKTPLTSIKMFSELLQKSTHNRPRAREYLHIIEGEADRLNRMVSTILESARIEKGLKQYDMQTVDLASITQEVVKNLSYMLKKHGFSVTLRLPRSRARKAPVPVLVKGDADAIAEVLINLLSNAIKYSPAEKVIELTLRVHGEWAICVVRDRGRGIPPEILPHIFKKFYRQPGVSGGVDGVGLGLSVAKHIVEAHGGRIEVESRVNHGSRFHVILPLKQEQPQEAKRHT